LGVKLPIWFPALLLTITCVLGVQMGHANPFHTSTFQEFFNDIWNNLIQWVWPLQLFSENLGVHWDSKSQSGSSFGSVRVHSLTLSYTLGNMRCDSQASFLARTLASLCLGCKPKARVATLVLLFSIFPCEICR